MKQADNIVLIGMPGVGKSTLGVLLAKATSRGFIDTDVSIQSREGRPLQDIIDADGPAGFRRVEERSVLALHCRHTVIATGGSVVYSAPAMAHLRALGVIVHLHLPLARLRERLPDFRSRGVVKVPGQSLRSLFAERDPLYRRYADVTVACAGKRHEAVVDEIVKAVARCSAR
jgi:shikimate kinase